MSLLLLFHGGIPAVIPPSGPAVGVAHLGAELRYRAVMTADRQYEAHVTVRRVDPGF